MPHNPLKSSTGAAAVIVRKQLVAPAAVVGSTMGGLSFKQSLGLVVFWYCVTLVFNWTAFNLVVLKDDPALALIPNDITLIEMFACTICGALTLYSKGLAFVPPPEVRTRMLALAITNAAACQLFMIAMDYVALSLVQTIRACQPLFTVVVGAPPSFSSRPEPSPAQPASRACSVVVRPRDSL